MNIPPISHYYRKGIPLCTRGVGVFSLHDPIMWLSHTGRIVEVVPYGKYPDRHPTLKVRGYYREHESYIVQDDRGKRWWPRVGNLHLLTIDGKEND